MTLTVRRKTHQEYAARFVRFLPNDSFVLTDYWPLITDLVLPACVRPLPQQ
jgi:hypothetical protein